MKILADTSVWVEFLRNPAAVGLAILQQGDLVLHDFVIGEVVLGGVSKQKLAIMRQMRRATSASHEEVMHLIETHGLTGRGVGYVDAHLLAAAKLNHTLLWTFDRYLLAIAAEVGCAYQLEVH